MLNKIKNYYSGVNMSFMLLSIFISCFLKSDNALSRDSVTTHKSQLKFERKFKDQLNNFAFLVKSITTPVESITHSTASGMIISSTNSHVFVLTADHFCRDSEDISLFKPDILIWNGERMRKAEILYSDSKNDICIITGIKYKDETFKNIKLAEEMPNIGEFTFNVAAPDGMGSPEVKLMFDGYFAGCESQASVCMFTIPATFGSSGSSVFNKKGELVSIIVMANPNFENVGIGPDIYTIKTAIKELEKYMVIK